MAAPWNSLPVQLSPQILSTINEMEFLLATKVQQECIPILLRNRDVVVEAQTGSGKTLAFLIPTLEMLLKIEKLKAKDVRAIIITPTRELAAQINEVLRKFLQHLPMLSSLLLIGGKNPEIDIKHFQTNGGNIIVATPGRLQDLLSRPPSVCDLARAVKALDILIMDEADRLLDMGFESSLSTILSYLPKQRRTGLFSATLTDAMEDLIRAGLRDPVRVIVRAQNDNTEQSSSSQPQMPSNLQNYYMLLEGDQKFNALVDFLKSNLSKKHLLFFTTCASVDYFSNALQNILKNKLAILSIHRKKDNRDKILARFKALDRGVLVCTDIMGRGIDMPDIDWVIQFDAPTVASNYVHRCGRTARMGRMGCAVIFLLPNEEPFVTFVQNTRKVKLGLMEPSAAMNDYLPRLKQLALSDRAIYEKGVRAFVSFIQSYSKHECSLIFQLKELEIGRLATGFALLHLPRMPELKGRTIADFKSSDVDIKKIVFKDKSREKVRQEKLLLLQNSDKEKKRTKKANTNNTPWSKQQEKKSKKLERKDRKRPKESENKSMSDMNDDDNDFSKDMRLMKKLKRGEITEEQFDDEFLGSPLSDDDSNDL